MKEPRPGIVQGALISVRGMHFLGAEFITTGMLGWERSPRIPRRVSRTQRMLIHQSSGRASRRSSAAGEVTAASFPGHAGGRARLHGPGTRAGALHHIPRFLSSLSLSSLLSLFLSPAVPWFHQISEGRPVSSAASAPALCGLNF